MMKIVDVILSDSFKSSVGPVQTIRRIKNSSDFFKEQGFLLNVFTKDNFSGAPQGTPIKKSSRFFDTKRAVFGWLAKHTQFFGKLKFKQAFDNSRWFIDQYTSLDRKPDVLVFHSLFDCYIYMTEHQIEGVKTCLFIHDDGTSNMFFSYYPKLIQTDFEREFRKKEMYVFENIDVQACITRLTERNLLKRAPALNGKTALVVNGISDISEEEKEETIKIRSSITSPKYRMVQVGSMNGRKGHREVIEALHCTRKEMLPDIHVTFVGGGYEKQDLEELVKKYGLESNITFEGVVQNKEVYKYLAKGNIAILISALEGLPLSLIEGMRSGMGIISTRVSGIPEIVNEGINGVLINPVVDELVEVFNNLNKYDWNKMGIESRKSFDDYYNFPRMRRDYIHMLQKALGDKM